MATSVHLRFSCNGTQHALRTSNDRLLIDVLREDLGLTGTKLGCGTGDCGACTVLLNGTAVNACLVYAPECEGADVETIEGVARSRSGSIVIEHLIEQGGIQCGICTPGFVVMAAAFLSHLDQPPDRSAIATALAGNLCRCTGYVSIIAAVETAGREICLEPPSQAS